MTSAAEAPSALNLRDAQPNDAAQILALNEASVHFLSPLDNARLALLQRQTAHHRVLVTDDGRVAAFLLALREGATYDSPNYRWFAARYPAFLYIDRVVVATDRQGQGLGRQLYADLFRFARHSGAGWVTCEFDIDPPNPASQRFHAGFGFRAVGTQTVGSTAKQVSLQAVAVTPGGIHAP